MTPRRRLVKATARVLEAPRIARRHGIDWRKYRGQSTCTMDLVNDTDDTSMIFSTLQYRPKFDIPVDNPAAYGRFPLVGMATALRHHQNTTVSSEPLDLVQASARRALYDKIIFLVQHGEENDTESELDVADLSGKGVGQALNLSRRMAAFCNSDTNLVPDLVLLAPRRSILTTTFLAFPYDTPQHSIRQVAWVCHPLAMDWADFSKASMPEKWTDLQQRFPGVDFSLLTEGPSTDSAFSSREETLLDQANSLLVWLRGRREQVVVGTFVAYLQCWVVSQAFDLTFVLSFAKNVKIKSPRKTWRYML